MNHVMENTLIVAVLLFILIVPFIIASARLKRKRKEKLGALLQDVTEKYRLTLSRSEPVGDKIVGWDAATKILICIANVVDEPQYIALKEAVKCRVLRTVNGTSVRSIALLFEGRNGQAVGELSLYRQFTDNEMKLKDIERQARHWEQLLNADMAS